MKVQKLKFNWECLTAYSIVGFIVTRRNFKFVSGLTKYYIEFYHLTQIIFKILRKLKNSTLFLANDKFLQRSVYDKFLSASYTLDNSSKIV